MSGEPFARRKSFADGFSQFGASEQFPLVNANTALLAYVRKFPVISLYSQSVPRPAFVTPSAFVESTLFSNVFDTAAGPIHTPLMR